MLTSLGSGRCAAENPNSEPLLSAHGLRAGYGPLQVLHELDLDVSRGECLAILGPNGAGKTTLLGSIIGLVRLSGGTLSFDGEDITNRPAHSRAAKGLVLVPEGRHLFAELTVLQNVCMGLRSHRCRRNVVEQCFELFPVLARRRDQLAGTLSGGEQQMLAIARGLATGPSVLMLDEPSLGLGPLIVEQVFGLIQQIRRDSGVAIILAEQDATALDVADRVLVMQGGRWIAGGSPDALRRGGVIESVYFRGSADSVGDDQGS